MKIIGYNYAVIHVFVHLLVMFLLYFAIQPDLSLDYVKMALIIAGTFVMDLDHIPLWMDKGVMGYLELRTIEEYGKPRKYRFHNLMILLLLLGGSSLVILQDYFFIGLFCASASLHLLWDLFEDVVVFKIGYRHWI